MKKLLVVSITLALSLTWPSSTAKASGSSNLIPIQARTCPSMLHEETTSVDVEVTPIEAETLPVPFVPESILEDIQAIELLRNPPRYGLDDMRGVVLSSPSVEQQDSFTLYEMPL